MGGLRIWLYLLTGGLFLSWLSPPRGIMEVLFSLVVILAAGYAETLFSRIKPLNVAGSRVVSLDDFRKSRNREQKPNKHRAMQTVFRTVDLVEAESVVSQLSQEGFNPRLFSGMFGNSGGGQSEDLAVMMHEVRLPAGQAGRSREFIQRLRRQNGD
ncbi:MAG: DUF2007 domain-containing protein [Deltaproteobacteria bacterium]|nr:DUF2007 domain-containing protein [Deltaproteobacteria bacterium]